MGNINNENFDSCLLKIYKKSSKNIGIYNIGYMTIKKMDDYKNINIVNSFYLMIGTEMGHFEEKMDFWFFWFWLVFG